MKAIRIHAHGGIDQICFEEVDPPRIQPGHVMMAVKACGMNHMDLWVRRGLPGVKVPLPITPGCDVSGVVHEVGTGVSHFKVGDEVVVSPVTSCGLCRDCSAGNDHLCRDFGIVGETCDGGQCEFLMLPARNFLPKPKGLSFVEAASVPLVFLTAWHMLVVKARVKPGDVVLVQAAGSGVGIAAVQIAKLFGATVIATASSEGKLEKAKALGADHGINYENQNVQKIVRDITSRRGCDIVFEHVGEKTFEDSYKSLRKEGVLVTCGATTGFDARLDLRFLFSRQLNILGSTMGSKSELFEIMRHVEAGRLKPVVDKTFSLAETAQAHEYLEARRQFGKVVLVP